MTPRQRKLANQIKALRCELGDETTAKLIGAEAKLIADNSKLERHRLYTTDVLEEMLWVAEQELVEHYTKAIVKAYRQLGQKVTGKTARDEAEQYGDGDFFEGLRELNSELQTALFERKLFTKRS